MAIATARRTGPNLATLAAKSSFAPQPDKPWMARYEVPDYDSTRLDHSINDAALFNLGIAVLADKEGTDPDLEYIHAVLKAMLDELRDREAITLDQYDTLSYGLDLLEEHGRRAVARAWLRDRGSIPLPRKP